MKELPYSELCEQLRVVSPTKIPGLISILVKRADGEVWPRGALSGPVEYVKKILGY